MVVLEVLSSPATRGTPVEPQARLPGVLRAAAQSAAPHEAAPSGPPPPAAGGAGAAQRDLGTRFHGRCAVRRPPLPGPLVNRVGDTRNRHDAKRDTEPERTGN